MKALGGPNYPKELSCQKNLELAVCRNVDSCFNFNMRPAKLWHDHLWTLHVPWRWFSSTWNAFDFRADQSWHLCSWGNLLGISKMGRYITIILKQLAVVCLLTPSWGLADNYLCIQEKAVGLLPNDNFEETFFKPTTKYVVSTEKRHWLCLVVMSLTWIAVK